MARGFATGVIWGTLVSVLGAGALSVMSARVENVAPLSPPAPMSVTAPVAPEPAPDAGPDAGPAPDAVQAGRQADDAAPAREEVRAPEGPAPDAAPDAAVSESPARDPAVVPALQTGGLSGGLSGGLLGADSGAAPQRPGAVADPVPDMSAPVAPDAGGTPAERAPVPGLEAKPPRVGGAPDAPDAGQPDQGARVTAALDRPGIAPQRGAAPSAPAPEAEPLLQTEPAPPLPEGPRAKDAPEQGSERRDSTEDAAEVDPAPRLATRAGSLLDRTPAVRESRLPRITPEAPAGPEPEEETAPAAEVAPAIPADTPLARNAVPFDPMPDVPRMAIILIDDGSGPLGPEALEAFPFPVSFAIAPGHPAPSEAASAYRDLGFEVLAIGSVPEGAQASDVEVALASVTAAVPQAVAVLEDPAAGLQGSRQVSSQTTAFLAASGHGLVTMPKGLNTAQKLALKAGVPSASLFRDFDGEGQDAGTIRRTLDQAMFRARQEGAVVMLGRLRADTISALVLWGLQDRSATITLVPVSTVLREAVPTRD